MKFQAYFAKLSAAQKRELAKRCRTTVPYFFQISGGHSRPSPALALRIERESGYMVTRRDLLPDVYPADDAA